MLQKSAKMTCPCCGQPMPLSTDLVVNLDYNTASRNGLMVGMEPQMAILLHELWRKWPTFVSHERIEKALYGWTQPEAADVKLVVRVQVCKLRKKMERLGVRVEPVYGHGYRLVL